MLIFCMVAPGLRRLKKFSANSHCDQSHFGAAAKGWPIGNWHFGYLACSESCFFRKSSGVTNGHFAKKRIVWKKVGSGCPGDPRPLKVGQSNPRLPSEIISPSLPMHCRKPCRRERYQKSHMPPHPKSHLPLLASRAIFS